MDEIHCINMHIISNIFGSSSFLFGFVRLGMHYMIGRFFTSPVKKFGSSTRCFIWKRVFSLAFVLILLLIIILRIIVHGSFVLVSVTF